MRSRIMRITLIVGMIFSTGACASREDWGVWKSHSTHFASGDHATFSMRNNKDGSQPRVSRSDITASKQQDWWGVYSINVTPDQIFQN
jgi:hypothetical protein